MEVLVFDIKSSLAHFRRPDTTNTHASYPFIPHTAVRGLVGSILGIPDFKGKALVGIRIMNPVLTTVQQMSMLGKGWLGGGKDFNRPTAIELLVAPYYRIYWTGDYFDELKEYLREGKSYYHTYLGSAFALTFPRYINTYKCEKINIKPLSPIYCSTVVPIDAISKLIPSPGAQYSRVGGMHCEYLGNRCFGITRNVLYEPRGNTVAIYPKDSSQKGDFRFCRLETDEVVCLW